MRIGLNKRLLPLFQLFLFRIDRKRMRPKKITIYTVGLGFAISGHEAALVSSHMNGLILFESRTIEKATETIPAASKQ